MFQGTARVQIPSCEFIEASEAEPQRVPTTLFLPNLCIRLSSLALSLSLSLKVAISVSTSQSQLIKTVHVRVRLCFAAPRFSSLPRDVDQRAAPLLTTRFVDGVADWTDSKKKSRCRGGLGWCAVSARVFPSACLSLVPAQVVLQRHSVGAWKEAPSP